LGQAPPGDRVECDARQRTWRRGSQTDAALSARGRAERSPIREGSPSSLGARCAFRRYSTAARCLPSARGEPGRARGDVAVNARVWPRQLAARPTFVRADVVDYPEHTLGAVVERCLQVLLRSREAPVATPVQPCSGA